jgi:hypothetical protein
MMMTFKEFVEKFNEAVPDPKEVEEYAKNPELQAVAKDPNKLRQKIIELKNKNTNIFKKAISAALASVPPTP